MLYNVVVYIALDIGTTRTTNCGSAVLIIQYDYILVKPVSKKKSLSKPLYPSQLAVLSSRVFNSTKQTPIQLDSSTLVAMGHILCGAKSTNLSSLNAVEFRLTNNVYFSLYLANLFLTIDLIFAQTLIFVSSWWLQ